MKPRLSSRIMLGLLTIFMCVMAVLPVLWMLLSSLRPLNEFFKMPQTIFPNVILLSFLYLCCHFFYCFFYNFFHRLSSSLHI